MHNNRDGPKTGATMPRHFLMDASTDIDFGANTNTLA